VPFLNLEIYENSAQSGLRDSESLQKVRRKIRCALVVAE